MTGYNDKFAKCPFFKTATSNTIECESNFAISCVNKFKNRESKMKHRHKYCDTYNYKNCSLCKNVFKKYTDTASEQRTNSEKKH